MYQKHSNQYSVISGKQIYKKPTRRTHQLTLRKANLMLFLTLRQTNLPQNNCLYKGIHYSPYWKKPTHLNIWRKYLNVWNAWCWETHLTETQREECFVQKREGETARWWRDAGWPTASNSLPSSLFLSPQHSCWHRILQAPGSINTHIHTASEREIRPPPPPKQGTKDTLSTNPHPHSSPPSLPFPPFSPTVQQEAETRIPLHILCFLKLAVDLHLKCCSHTLLLALLSTVWLLFNGSEQQVWISSLAEERGT